MAGDVNGDGYGDFIVGAPGYTSVGGRAFVYYGNGSGGLDRVPRHANADGSPLFLLGKSNDNDDFALIVRVRTSVGRDSIIAQWETGTERGPFSGVPTGQSSATDTGPPVSGEGSSALDTTAVGPLQPHSSYRWQMRLASMHPFFPHSPWFTSPYNSPAEIDLRLGIGQTGVPAAARASGPRLVELDRIRPNPFNPTVSIKYSLSETARVDVDIYDVCGRMVTRLVGGLQTNGPHSVLWDGTDQRGKAAASGVYFVRVASGGVVASKKVTLLR